MDKLELYSHRVIMMLMTDNLRSVAVCVDKTVIRATRVLYGKKGKRKRPTKRRIEIVLTVGRPNYYERQWLKRGKGSIITRRMPK